MLYVFSEGLGAIKRQTTTTVIGYNTEVLIGARISHCVRRLLVPELSRFFGIIIRMYMEAGGPHHLPHFHAYYQEDVAVVGLDPIDMIAGHLPRRQRRLVEAWAELHQQELINDWDRLQEGAAPLPIAPLE